MTYNAKPSQGDLFIGAQSGGSNAYDGSMDTFGLWARAWDDDDVAAYWASGSGVEFPFY